MKVAELRDLPIGELNSKLDELKEEYMRIRCNTVLKTESDVHQVKKTRRDIARVNTIINEKQRNPTRERLNEKG